MSVKNNKRLLVKYPLSYNPILEYWNQIQNGEITVCNKIRQTYRKLVYDLENQTEYFYSAKRANHIIEFIENYCKHSKGKFAGQPVFLELWEKAMLAAVFGFVDIDGFRKYREALLIVGKKNGKSLIASCVGNYMFVGDGEGGSEVYAVATKKDQSKIIWSEAKRMVKKSPALSKRIRPLVAEMVCDANDGVFKPLASDSNTLDGLNVHCVLMDEIHAWTNGKALYDIMADGVTAREQPLIFITSTAGMVREDIYDLKYEEAERVINGYFTDDGYKDERFISFVYELDSRKEWTDSSCWIKANPCLGTIKSVETLERKVEQALKNPMLVKNLVCKEFNIRETSSEAWLTFDEINNTATFDIDVIKPTYGIGGTDLSSSVDLTSAKVIFQVPDDANIYVLSMYWLPEDLLEVRTKEDKIPYDLWYEQGYLRLSRGNKVNPSNVTEWFLEIQETYGICMYAIGYDAWSAAMWIEEMRACFTKEAMVPVIQGKKTLSAPMKSLGADLAAKRIIYNNNPIDKWCMLNTSYEEDRNGNIQPKKTSKPTRRIDGLASLLDAYVVLQEKMAEYQSII